MEIKGRKLKEKQERYNAILEASEKIMQADGLYGLNMDLVAKETQLAKGTLYLYFKNKEEILAALSLKSRNLLFEAFAKSIKKSKTPIEQLKAIILANYQFFKKYPLYFELVSLYEINNKLTETEELQQSSYKISQMVVEIAQKAKDNKTLNPNIDPVNFSICLWGMTVGMIQLIKVRGAIIKQYQGISEKEILSSFVAIVENGIRD
ncbi:TetR/AcrR family transcriptional regulator [Parasediminibacterium paludis]|uniref:TetR/AcrR family transcriptional regulator n=1 Tax=Parasediminibacterium paludis TaxID=908966 RepID=A0ABV8PWL5_9BACT